MCFFPILLGLFHVGLLPPVLCAELQVTGYPGALSASTYQVRNLNMTWHEAYYDCLESGGNLIYRNSQNNFVYIRSLILKHNGFATGVVWTGIYKERDNMWVSVSNCRSKHSYTIYNENQNEEQCLLLNITGVNISESHFHAASCEVRANYICEFRQGSTTRTSSESYVLYENKRYLHGKIWMTESLPSLFDCVVLSFGCFSCYGGEYMHSTNSCVLFNEKSYHLPIDINITESSEERTFILKNTSQVSFIDTTVNKRTIYQGSNEFPCEMESSTPATCQCNCTRRTLTNEEIQQKIDEMKQQLLVQEESLSSYTRRKQSAPDHRTSSKALGFVGVVFLALTGFLLCVGDFITLLRFLTQISQT